MYVYLRTCCACTCKDYVCIHSQPKWPCHFGSSLILYWETREKFLCYHFVTSYAMASSSYVVDTTVSGQQVGVLPPDVPQELAGSIDSFQHVEAVMKEDDVSTVGMDSQDWELVTEMVAETENAATDFMQGTHVSLEAPKQDLQSSLQAMEETMANLKLGKAARGVDVPSTSEGVASATAAIGAEAPSRPEGVAPVLAAETEDVQMDLDKEVDPQGQQGQHGWLMFGRSEKAQTFTLRDVPFKMEPISKEIKQLVERLDKEEVIDLFSKFCDLPIIPAVGFARVRPTLPSRHKSSMMRSCASDMSKDVLALELEMRAFRIGLWALQEPHTSAPSASLIGPLPGQWMRRRSAFATRKWLPSRRRLIWQPWSRSNTGGSFLSLAMALRGCGTVPRNLKLRLPVAVTSGWNRWFRTWTSRKSMRWISVDLRKLPCAQQITLRPHSRTILRALTACNLEPRYSTGWWMRKHSLLLISPDLRFPRTSSMGRRLWFSIRMLRRLWRWRQSWPQQTSLRRRLSTPKSQSKRWMRWFQQMQISSMTCRVERSRWKTLRVQRCCAALICWNSKRSWRGSFWKGQDPTRALLKLWPAPWWAWIRPRHRIGSMRRRGGSTSPSSHLQWGPRFADFHWARDLFPPDGLEEAKCGPGLLCCTWWICQSGEYVKAKLNLVQHKLGAFPPQCQLDLQGGSRCARWQGGSIGGYQARSRIPWGQGGYAPQHAQHVQWWDPDPCWQMDQIWVHGGAELGQGETTFLGRSIGPGKEDPSYWPRWTLCGVPHLHGWGDWGPPPFGASSILVIPEGKFLCLGACACPWRCRDLLGKGSADLDSANFAGSVWPPILPQTAVVCLGKSSHCGEATWSRSAWWRSCWRPWESGGT